MLALPPPVVSVAEVTETPGAVVVTPPIPATRRARLASSAAAGRIGTWAMTSVSNGAHGRRRVKTTTPAAGDATPGRAPPIVSHRSPKGQSGCRASW